ncbi:hypothetical protein FOYG_06280 [Fusarium oxysporum NRRL 32931]|uniref:Uncharacterized protein n=1 Tax=Fusarium oxysporum NRRL 32931 TaxID=660029 RepID=W9IJZ5_FUSOX|nr:hypothetical protein FOYG_06280 [Fusarium oxysporum NRRL 32931]EWY92845.1 hypothetical protein FOYG_06280 [Fusarium oxysporum NRRL 32931]EWY92846.1 hypothetical protein FOYG_06280 [Fusarium oxysporum NRRL 32931]EWY92847.1 hypothetical protein FOYG_06280 [Fusarium oxysporum NRRL 32931]
MSCVSTRVAHQICSYLHVSNGVLSPIKVFYLGVHMYAYLKYNRTRQWSWVNSKTVTANMRKNPWFRTRFAVLSVSGDAYIAWPLGVAWPLYLRPYRFRQRA